MRKMRKPCCEKEGRTNKGAWSKQEDQKLIHYISTYGEGSWRSLPKAAGLDRCGKSCRLRWINYLRPDIKRGNFGLDEEDLIIKLHALLGNRWSLIAGRLPGRTDNEVKNYWNSNISKKLIKMGIDPNNHRLHQINKLAHHHDISPGVLVNDDQKVSSIHNSENSCGSMNITSKLVPLKCDDDDDKNDRASDVASCLVEDKAYSSAQLNLELTIAFPYSSRK